MGSLDAIHRCTIGGTAFQLEDFSDSEDPVIRGGRRDGSAVALRGRGWVEADDTTALAVALNNARNSCRTSGQNVEVFGPGGVPLYQLTAAQCVDGGPHIAFTVEPGLLDSGGARHFSFTVTAETKKETGQGGGEDQPTSTRSVATAPDDLKTVRWEGDLAGADVAALFEQLRLGFAEQFMLPRWVVSHELSRNAKGDKATFRLTATEMMEDLPFGATGTAVDGRAAFSRERDDQMRLVKRYDFDLLVKGDVDTVLDAIRPEGLILAESVQIGRYDRQRVRALFITLEGGNGNALMNWQASFEYQPPTPSYEVRTYPGAAPILVQRPQTFGRLTFTGSAVGAGVFINPPAPPAGALLEPPLVSRTHVNEVEKRTDWRYVVAIDEGSASELPLELLSRPVDAPPSPLPESKPRTPLPSPEP